MPEMTEDKVREEAGRILGFKDSDTAISGVGQLTSWKQLGFKGVKGAPDGWYFPKDKSAIAIVAEFKSTIQPLEKWVVEILGNCAIVQKQYKRVIGILWNGADIMVFKNGQLVEAAAATLQNKEYYLSLFTQDRIDKQKIYNLTKRINDCLHSQFGIKNLYHRMIFTACALVAKRYGAFLEKDMEFKVMTSSILSQLSKSLEQDRKQNLKLDLLIEVYSEIKMNFKDNHEAINNFIQWVTEISDCVNSDFWNGEDVMGIFFNEFNRYKKKSESGQIFTPDHITSFMYRLIDVNKSDKILDATCGSGAFLVKSMCNMIKEAGGVKTNEAKSIKSCQLFGIEFDREIFALACANMLIHKDGKTNLEQLDSRLEAACNWIKSKGITKVLMNPPYERKYGCMKIVNNVLDSVPEGTMCAFILPDKKLEKDGTDKNVGNKVLKKHRLLKIIKLPENLFFGVGVTTSIFVFEAGHPQNGQNIIGYYIEEDGLETVKNQGRQDIKNRWPALEDYWVEAIHDGVEERFGTRQIIRPSEHLSYQLPEKPFEIFEEDFIKTMVDYEMFKRGIDVKDFNDKLIQKVMYSSEIQEDDDSVTIKLKK